MAQYGHAGYVAPVIMTEVYGYCATAWPSAPDDFTAMLNYNYDSNIGTVSWVFDHTGDETDAVITALGAPPNEYTAPWTWAASNCSGTPKDWQGTAIYGPGNLFSDWMVSH